MLWRLSFSKTLNICTVQTGRSFTLWEKKAITVFCSHVLALATKNGQEIVDSVTPFHLMSSSLLFHVSFNIVTKRVT